MYVLQVMHMHSHMLICVQVLTLQMHHLLSYVQYQNVLL